MTRRVLLTGGAGYIGAATARLLLEEGWQVSIVDNLFRGRQKAIPSKATFFQGDLRDRHFVQELLRKTTPDAVLHFAGLAYVGESFQIPEKYFAINTGATITLVEAMQNIGCNKLIFSSSCSVYGLPEKLPLSEDALIGKSQSPYALSKLMAESFLGSLREQGKLHSICLRYFNAAGATLEHGQTHRPETRIIPLVVDAALGFGSKLKIFGKDYPTPDGTARRDYVHILDLARAHAMALDRLVAGSPLPPALNLGSGEAVSILDIVREVERLSEREVPKEFHPRREGDAPELVASSNLAQEVLGWSPKHSSLKELVESTMEWRRSLPPSFFETTHSRE